jgi:dipeptidyl aminopeptidase/acylaminoacyl peptidase
MKRLFGLILGILLCSAVPPIVSAPAVAAEDADLDAFLCHPIAAGLAVSADGARIAWILNERGLRNIHTRDAHGRVFPLTRYADDDGQELSGLAFSPDGSRLVYVRGGSPNRQGENPNPASLPEGVEQAIWAVDSSGRSEPFRVAAGSSPVFFPDGRKILFSRGGQIFEAEVAPGAEARPLFRARGRNVGPTFSPDGKEILFTSARGDHSYVGVYNLESVAIRWIAPDTGRDMNPVWAPDGRRIAFIRRPGLRFGELSDLTSGVPFSIRVVDAATGEGVAVWTSTSDDGGFAQTSPASPLVWTKTGRILFYSEHEGWMHIYSMNPDGSDLRDLTPGEGEVESHVLDAAEKTVYFSWNHGDIDRRHIWRTDVERGGPIQVTFGAGIEMYPDLAGDKLLFFRSTFNMSKSLVRFDKDKAAFEVISPLEMPGFSSERFVEPEQVILKAQDGTTVHAQLFVDRRTPGLKPGVVYMHGGPIRQMLLGFHYSDYYIHCYAFNQFLAARGYAVLSVNFRAGVGYGRDFRRAENQGPRGASEYQDVVAAAKYLQSMPEVDPERIGLWGGSYGGYLTAMGLARNPEIFKAGVDLHGVHDWAERARLFSTGAGWGLREEDLDLAYRSSPVSDLSLWTGPVLFVHGDDDRNVLFQQTTDLAEKLRDKGVVVEVLALPDEVHGFLRYASWIRVLEAAEDFFDRHL